MTQKRMPIFASQVWGETLLLAVNGRPIIVGLDKLNEFYKKNQAAMFVANHNSWLDIPFLGTTIGWRNYKIVSKAELGRVPILGKAIKMGGHLMLDRTNQKSQLKTLRQGMDLLKVSVPYIKFEITALLHHTCFYKKFSTVIDLTRPICFNM